MVYCAYCSSIGASAMFGSHSEFQKLDMDSHDQLTTICLYDYATTYFDSDDISH